VSGVQGESIAYFLEILWNGFVEYAHLCRLRLFFNRKIERRSQLKEDAAKNIYKSGSLDRSPRRRKTPLYHGV